MQVIEVEDRSQQLIKQLLVVWESAVKATHLFLLDSEIKNIRPFVSQALEEIPHLCIIKNKKGLVIAFMGIVDQKIEMLFISNEERGKGFGKILLEYGIEQYAIHELSVNEQNPLAREFYEHMGFQVYKRSKNDEQGNPYPILYMKLDS